MKKIVLGLLVGGLITSAFANAIYPAKLETGATKSKYYF